MIDADELLTDWDEDIQAAAGNDRTFAMRFSGILGMACIVGAFACGGLLKVMPHLVIPLMATGICGVAALVYAGRIQHAMRTATVPCTRCRKPMKEEISPCPDEFASGHWASHAFRGESGNLYFLERTHFVGTGMHDTKAFEIRTKWRICAQCKRYTLLLKHELVPIGTGEEAIQDREDQLRRLRKAVHRLSGKKIVKKDPT